MIPGKKYRPEDFLEIAWRRKWAVLIPLLVVSLGVFGWTLTLPDRYRSQASVLVVAPQVPENYVRPTVTDSLQDRLTAMQQQILSRTRLERIVTELDLYKEQRKRMLLDEVIGRMRDDIKVQVPKVRRRDEPGSFTIGFEYGEAKTAMLVAERLASLFVRENVEGRSVQADVTNQFMRSEVDKALRTLQDQEKKLEVFRQANIGRLPSQVQSNLQLMQNLRQELQTLSEEINRDIDRQITIQRTIADEMGMGHITAGRTGGREEPPQTATQELASAKEALAQLRLRLTEEHPDVRAATRRISEIEKKVAAEALQQPLADGRSARPLTPTEAERQRRLSGLRGELESLDRNIAFKRAQAEKLTRTLNEYKNRIELAPALESQLAQLTRDYETFQTSYTTLLKKAQDAEIASNLEQRQVGQQFRIIDAPRVPERPSSPNRVRLNLIGLLAALGLGLTLAALLEYRDTALRTEEDVLVALSLPVLALVPTMTTLEDRKRRRRRLLLIGGPAAALMMISVVTLAWKLRLFENWTR